MAKPSGSNPQQFAPQGREAGAPNSPPPFLQHHAAAVDAYQGGDHQAAMHHVQQMHRALAEEIQPSNAPQTQSFLNSAGPGPSGGLPQADRYRPIVKPSETRGVFTDSRAKR
jgi:hypothetical protein